MKIASIDVGLKRIGVAITLDSSIVMPQPAIIRKNRNQASREVREFIDEWDIELLVVGLPKDGSSSDEMERRIKHFISLIDRDIEVIYQDEQGTSFEASDMTKGKIKHKRDGRLDSISAKIILERYLESKK
ncbi:Putative Holliday junction resolvase YggF [hydrothermal vent metagenome]|uniref:Putative Holliday junction resolvase YggF n=1 Tax=hydrothermal vent metagenome TaxID=652676 RepID=A0A1W1EHF4_9ZZZZ